MQLVFEWLMLGRLGNLFVPTGDFSVIRKTFPALRTTVLKDFTTYLKDTGGEHYIDHKKSTHEFISYDKQRTVSFFSADDEHKLRGRKHTFFWMNEADGFDYDDFFQLIKRTDHCGFLDFNPANGYSWIRTHLEEKRVKTKGDVYIDVSTYFDNPFLSQELIDEIESLKETDMDLYRVYAEGRYPERSGGIFQDYSTYKKEPNEISKKYIGLDFGWANDPAAAVMISQTGKDLYCRELFYKTKMTNQDIYEELKEFGTTKIIADSQNGKDIEELRKMGLRIKPVKKTGSVNQTFVQHTIQKVKQHNLFIKEDSHNFLTELREYKYVEKTVNGETKQVPRDAYNHLIDAMRYGVSMESKRTPIKML